jgi:hypothetical protein
MGKCPNCRNIYNEERHKIINRNIINYVVENNNTLIGINENVNNMVNNNNENVNNMVNNNNENVNNMVNNNNIHDDIIPPYTPTVHEIALIDYIVNEINILVNSNELNYTGQYMNLHINGRHYYGINGHKKAQKYIIKIVSEKLRTNYLIRKLENIIYHSSLNNCYKLKTSFLFNFDITYNRFLFKQLFNI